MGIDDRVLARLLHMPQTDEHPGAFSLFSGGFQTERQYILFYSNNATQKLVVPHDRLSSYQQAFSAHFAGTDDEVIQRVRKLENDQLEVIGPIVLSVLDPETFSLKKQDAVNGFALVKLGERHIPALKDLETACKPIEWEHASLDYEDLSNAYGAVDGDKVVAVAHYLVFDGDIASIGVVTHPDYRGKGLVTALSVWTIRHALDAGCHVIYRTMGWNSPAIQVAHKLGFTDAGEYTLLKLGKRP